MLYDLVDYTSSDDIPDLGDDHIFRYCTFVEVDEKNLLHIASIHLNSEFNSTEFYGTLFNAILLYRCIFTNCIFAGSRFGGCTLVECEFHSCKFIPNNLGQNCSLEESKFVDCIFDNCDGLSDETNPAPA